MLCVRYNFFHVSRRYNCFNVVSWLFFQNKILTLTDTIEEFWPVKYSRSYAKSHSSTVIAIVVSEMIDICVRLLLLIIWCCSSKKKIATLTDTMKRLKHVFQGGVWAKSNIQDLMKNHHTAPTVITVVSERIDSFIRNCKSIGWLQVLGCQRGRFFHSKLQVHGANPSGQ